MDPGVGRFAAVDPFTAEAFAPLTLHRYAYAGGNPVNAVDPTGLFLSVSVAMGSMMSSIASIAVPGLQAAERTTLRKLNPVKLLKPADKAKMDRIAVRELKGNWELSWDSNREIGFSICWGDDGTFKPTEIMIGHPVYPWDPAQTLPPPCPVRSDKVAEGHTHQGPIAGQVFSYKDIPSKLIQYLGFPRERFGDLPRGTVPKGNVVKYDPTLPGNLAEQQVVVCPLCLPGR